MSQSETVDFVISLSENAKNVNRKTARETVSSVRSSFETGKTRNLEFRKGQLKNLLAMLEENSEAFYKVLKEDLGRSWHEAIVFDVEGSMNDIRRILYKIDEWDKPYYPGKTLPFWMDVVKVVNDPYGVVLIIGSWNYPLMVVLSPLAGAIAAGNCVILKPSEIAASTADLLAALLPKYLDESCYRVYLGGVEETTTLLDERFDYIFYTGSAKVGRIVHSAANRFLTPVTLELGGKSPVYLDETANLEMAVRRIMWGKCGNAGQTCIAPDYLLCPVEVRGKFIELAKKVLKEWYGSDVKASPDFPPIVNASHFTRLLGYLTDKNNVAVGGQVDPSKFHIEPTILINVSPNHPIMLEEIFGPILPVITVKNVQEAVGFINAREKPLALYVFTRKNVVKKIFMEKTSSGSLVVNDTLLQYGILDLPFGGVGNSGMGKYHGKDSYDTFVHKKSVVEKNFNLLLEKAASIRYPPYTKGKTAFMRGMLRTRRGLDLAWAKYVLTFGLGIVFVICVQIVYYNVTNKSLI